MKNSTLNRSMLSDENMALLAELKSQNDSSVNEGIVGSADSSQSKQDALDYLWQNFKLNNKDEKSPGIYILTGFIAGALSMFLMTAMLSITTFSNSDNSSLSSQRKITLKKHASFDSFNFKSSPKDIKKTNPIPVDSKPSVVYDKYIVKAGDSLGSISVKFFGQATPQYTSKIQNANNLPNPHSIYAGQELLIPLN